MDALKPGLKSKTAAMPTVRVGALKPRLNLRKQNRCDAGGEDGLAEAGSLILPYNICEFALNLYTNRNLLKKTWGRDYAA